jgi:hypothetical protein
MRAVLLISMGSLSSHRFTSFIDGSLVPCFNSTLLGDTMAAAWVQKNARWDRFPSSEFGQINGPKRKTLGTSLSLLKLPLKFSDRRRKSKRSSPGKNRGRTAARAPLGQSDRAGRPTLFRGAGPVRFTVYRPFFAFSAYGKSWPRKSSRETPEN